MFSFVLKVISTHIHTCTCHKSNMHECTCHDSNVRVYTCPGTRCGLGRPPDGQDNTQRARTCPFQRQFPRSFELRHLVLRVNPFPRQPFPKPQGKHLLLRGSKATHMIKKAPDNGQKCHVHRCLYIFCVLCVFLQWAFFKINCF